MGLFLLQLAVRLGIPPAGVGRRAMHEPMRALGAWACIDYSDGD